MSLHSALIQMDRENSHPDSSVRPSKKEDRKILAPYAVLVGQRDRKKGMIRYMTAAVTEDGEV